MDLYIFVFRWSGNSDAFEWMVEEKTKKYERQYDITLHCTV